MSETGGRRGPGAGALLFGIVLIGLGAYLLLAQAGLIPQVRWGDLWPLLLVALGIVIIVAALTRPAAGGSVVVPRASAGRLHLELGIGAGDFRVSGGASELVEARSLRGSVQSRVSRTGDVADVRLRPETPWWPFWGGTLDWDVRVASDIATDLLVTGGAGSFALDLSKVIVTSARCTVGAASVRLTLPVPRGDVPVTIGGGAASFLILVPAGIEARVTASGLVSIDGRPETPGYGGARDRVTVTVSGGAASVSIRAA